MTHITDDPIPKLHEGPQPPLSYPGATPDADRAKRPPLGQPWRWSGQDAQLPQDDETRRLLAAFEACRAKELAAADQLSKPRHSMLSPAYTRLVDALGAVRLECNDIRLAIRAHRKEMPDKGK
jgi:hypothetical protein